MNRFRYLAWLTPFVLAALVFSRSGLGEGDEPLSAYSPEGYIRRADALIATGLVAANCRRDTVQIEADIRRMTEEDRAWYEASYLSEDVALFNQDPESYGWRFVIDDSCRLRGVNRQAHVAALPFTHPIRWLGSLFYRSEGADAQLRSPRRAITLRAPEGPVAAAEQTLVRVGAAEEPRLGPGVLFHFAGGPGQKAARVGLVSETPVVWNLVPFAEPASVHLLGVRLPAGRVARLLSGDWLHLANEEPRRTEETFVVVAGRALEAASVVRLQNDKYTRTTEDPQLGELGNADPRRSSPYLELVPRGIDAALAALPEERGKDLAERFDLQLTLRRDAQYRLSRVFREQCRIEGEKNGDDRPFPAGMTVMDGVSGEVLALATYPGPDDLDALPESAVDSRERRRLLRNQNLIRHPIGSAGKPFLFAAVADAHPFLETLVLDPYPEEEKRRDLFQCQLPAGYRIPAATGGPIDFRTALQISSNRYVVELATLALAADRGQKGTPELRRLIPPAPGIAWPLPGESSGVTVLDQRLDYAPDLSGYVTDPTYQLKPDTDPTAPPSRAAIACATLDKMENAHFRRPLEEVTGAWTYFGRNPTGEQPVANLGNLSLGYSTNRYDLSPWRPLLDLLLPGTSDDQAWRIRGALQEMSPERVNLSFNQISGLRSHFVNLALGTEPSLWTNLQLAEAMSRLVTNRTVEARLAAAVLRRPPGPAGVPPPTRELTIRPSARRAVLEGIAKVVQPGGTAVQLAPALARLRQSFPGEAIDIYSKTGSPYLVRATPKTTAEALEKLVRRQRLIFNDRRIQVALDRGAVDYAAPRTAGRAAFRTALAQALREVRQPSSTWVINAIAGYIDQLAKGLRPRQGEEEGVIRGPLGFDRGSIFLRKDHQLFTERLEPYKGAIYIFSLVRRPAAEAGKIPEAADFGQPNRRVLTVAIYLGVGPDSHTAVEVAGKLLPELAAYLK